MFTVANSIQRLINATITNCVSIHSKEITNRIAADERTNIHLGSDDSTLGWPMPTSRADTHAAKQSVSSRCTVNICIHPSIGSISSNRKLSSPTSSLSSQQCQQWQIWVKCPWRSSEWMQCFTVSKLHAKVTDRIGRLWHIESIEFVANLWTFVVTNSTQQMTEHYDYKLCKSDGHILETQTKATGNRIIIIIYLNQATRPIIIAKILSVSFKTARPKMIPWWNGIAGGFNIPLNTS